MIEREVLQAKCLMEELILSIITVDSAKSRVSFKYVSPEWIGSPGWYFWPKERLGVFFIRLEYAQVKENVLETLFDLYYYPHPEEDVYGGFSCIEQAVRVNDIFSKKGVAFAVACECQNHCGQDEFSDLRDGKGVPSPQYRQALSPWLYRIGAIRAAWNGNELQEWGVEAQVISRTWGVMDVALPGDDGKTHMILERHGVDRNLYAWELAECFCSNFLADLQVLEMSPIIKEKTISTDPYAKNKVVFSLDRKKKDIPVEGGVPAN